MRTEFQETYPVAEDVPQSETLDAQEKAQGILARIKGSQDTMSTEVRKLKDLIQQVSAKSEKAPAAISSDIHQQFEETEVI